MKRLIIGILLVAASAPLNAKDNDWPKVSEDCKQVFSPETGDSATPMQPLWKRTIACGTDFFTARPVHLAVKSIVPGGGFGPGLTFHEDFNSDKWQKKLESTSVASFQAFWSTENRFRATHDKFGKRNSARDRFALDVYANARGLPRLDFYGIGPKTLKSNVVIFRERDVIAGVDIFNPVASWLALGGQIESIWPNVGGASATGVPSITSAFNEGTAPGLSSQPNYIHYEGYLEPRPKFYRVPFDYKIGYAFYQDTDTGHFSFRRFRVDGNHIWHPFNRQEDVFTVHGRLTISDTSAGHAVPFYLEETLGGSNIDGEPTLRGFPDYRFRAPDLLLIQADYDHRFWGPLGGLVFYDTGEVTTQVSDFSLAQMRHSFGFGVSLWAGNRSWFKIYVGLGSGEVVHPYFGIPKL